MASKAKVKFSLQPDRESDAILPDRNIAKAGSNTILSMPFNPMQHQLIRRINLYLLGEFIRLPTREISLSSSWSTWSKE